MLRPALAWGCALCLALSLSACGSGESDNDLTTGTLSIGQGGGGPVVIPLTPTPPLQDDTGTGMNARELAFASDLFRLVNEHRVASLGEGAALQWDAPTAAVAMTHTLDQWADGILSRDGPSPCATPADCLAQRLDSGGVLPRTGAGENVARGQLTAATVMDAWTASSPQAAILLDPTWTHMGAGYKEGTSPINPAANGPWWTLDFVAK